VQRDQLVALLDQLKAAGVNAVMFQVRPECDALYLSSIEPWSYWLTGIQGSPPNPLYDPLTFAVEEAHKRGMELHAWFNPYRAVRNSQVYSLSSMHVAVQHPEWILTFGSLKILDPGLPFVRNYVATVVADIVRSYDVDAVHADDYFYPYPPDEITNEDDATFAAYNRGFTDRGAWRRDNVNLLMKQVADSILAIKPHVKFGMSPFGIWKDGVPSGIFGLDAYNVIYGDAIAWLQQHTVDYLAPQLYWRIGGGQDFSKLMPWWADSTNRYDRHLYVGHIFGSYTTSELPNQVRLIRRNPKAQGSIFFRAANFPANTLGFSDSLKRDLYKYPALLPVVRWKDSIPPNPARNIQYARIPGTNGAAIQWDLPLPASDGDTASRYVIYRFDHAPSLPAELDLPQNIASVEGRRYSTPPTPPTTGEPYYYVVTSLDRSHNEGPPTNAISVMPSPPPLLAAPLNGATDLPASTVVRWFAPLEASSYRLQVGTDSSFTANLLVHDSTLVDTSRVVTGLEGQRKYHWRVRAANAGGTGPFSDTWSFLTGFPATPLLAVPANYTIPAATNMYFRWHPAQGAASYRFQLAETFDFSPTVVDTTFSVDTAFTVNGLRTSKIYFWRVQATNTIGPSIWSETWRFKTDSVATLVAEGRVLPSQFELSQNYPNPFNPTTTIVFRIPVESKVSLRVYNVLGEEVRVLSDEVVSAGEHASLFDASGLPSGVYFYRLIVGGYADTKKMQYVK
jgi:uncharacterized lipoprotein YddW (UPF0748 family)